MINICKFFESIAFTCFYFYVLLVLCVFFFDVFVLFEFSLLPCANKDMTMMIRT